MSKTIQNGDMAEAIVMSELLKEGFQVFMPFSHNTSCDLIIISTLIGRPLKIQVKKAFIKLDRKGKGSRYIETRKRTDSGGKKYSINDFDYCIACDVITNECWIISIFDYLKVNSGINLDTVKSMAYYKEWKLLKGG